MLKKAGYIIFFFFVLLSIAGAEEKAPEPITLQLKWLHQFQFAGYYAAKAKGFYEDIGLDVYLKPGGYSIDVVSEVESGRAQYGVSNSEVVLRRLRGSKIVVTAVIFQHSPLVFVSRKSSGIVSPQDIAGRKVKMTQKTRNAELHAALQNEGISLKNLKLIEGDISLEDYLSPDIDVLTAYVTNEPFLLRQRGLDFNIIRPLTYGVDFYGDCLFTSEDELKKNPERVRAFREASIKGWNYAMSHPDEIIRLIRRRYNKQKSIEHLRYEALTMRELIMPELVEMGHMNPGRWEHIADTFVALGFARPDYNLEGFLYDPSADLYDKRVQKIFRASVLGLLAALCLVLALMTFNQRLRREIRERVRAEEQLVSAQASAEDAAQAKNEFFANISHEIRTPLNAVIGFSELLKPLMKDQKKRYYVEAILTSGRSLLTLINDILDLSRIEAGKMSINYSPVNLAQIFQDIEKIFFSEAAGKDVNLYFKIDKNIPPFLIMDESRVRQVLINLVGNALKFTDSGDISISAWKPPDSSELRDKQKTDLILSVEDSGSGISGEESERIFDPFYQSESQQDAGKSSPNSGSGLGLAICSRLVQIMGGELSLYSQPGHGTTFEILLQNIRVASKELSGSDKNTPLFQTPLENIQFDGGRILIVEDAASGQLLLKNMLEELGFQGELADNGEAALEAARIWKPQLVISDIRMKEIKGIEIARKLKNIPALSSIPVVALSSRPKEIMNGFEHLFDACLSKPLEAKQLIQVLSSYFHSVKKQRGQIYGLKRPLCSSDRTVCAELRHDIEQVNPELKRLFKEEVAPLLDLYQDVFIISELKKLMQDLIALGEAYNFQKIIGCAHALNAAVQCFDVIEIHNILKQIRLFISDIERHDERKVQ